MNTLAFVAEVNELIYRLEHCSADDIRNKFQREVLFYHELVDSGIDEFETSINELFDRCTNPTLPCLSRLASTAKRQGYNVIYK